MRWSGIGLMIAHRLRRLRCIGPMLAKRIFADRLVAQVYIKQAYTDMNVLYISYMSHFDR